MDNNTSWFETFSQSDAYALLQRRPVAYFCAEYALQMNLPLYAGGLGVLAGDYIEEAADRRFPMVAVGLYYREGYVYQQVNENGEITEASNYLYPQETLLEPVFDQQNRRITVKVPIGERDVVVQAWKVIIQNVTLYLLDTTSEENTPDDQEITNRLYVSDKEFRLKQEIILGIGGLRMLEALHIHPAIYHMNEGHSALLSLELIRHEMQERKLPFLDGKNIAKDKIVFTNHTLVAGGNDTFNVDLVSLLLSRYAEKELQIPVKEIIEIGRVQDSSTFSMMLCSLHMAGKANAVSIPHAKYASQIWPEYQMVPITNGVHMASWNLIRDPDNLWKSHQENKKILLEKIKEETGSQWDEHTLLVGWARRMVKYKRPLALFEDIDALTALAKDADRQIRFVIAGEAHPTDTEGLEMIKMIRQKIKEELHGIVVYLPNYSLPLAHLLISGCDVWLNTPVVGSEACGTSGMKALLNGCLPLSTKDGWVGEFEMFGIGWLLDTDNISQSILRTLKNQILPMYYTRAHEIPVDWGKNMRNGRELILKKYTTARMLRDYIQKVYVPMMQALQEKKMLR